MVTYQIVYRAATDLTVEVEADSLSDAIDQADEVSFGAQLCAQCSGWGERWSRDDGDYQLVQEECTVDDRPITGVEL